MMTFVYFACFEPGDRRGIVVNFPDVPEAITEGRDEEDARAQAAEALGLALLTYPERRLPLPRAKTRGRGLVPIAVEADIAAKLAVLEAFRQSTMSKSELGRLLGKDEKEVRCILDPKHPTKLGTLTQALCASLPVRSIAPTSPPKSEMVPSVMTSPGFGMNTRCIRNCAPSNRPSWICVLICAPPLKAPFRAESFTLRLGTSIVLVTFQAERVIHGAREE
jgi:antitoxin HicB